ncbi:E3 ubiquitin-protein ligase APD2 [Linum perenne]
MDGESHHTSPPPSSSSYSAIDVDGGASPSNDDSGRNGDSSSSQAREDDEDREQVYHRFPEPRLLQHQQEVGVSDRGRNSTAADGLPSIGDDTWSCVTVILTFWLFVSMTLIFGVYGPESLKLGPNCSLLVRPNPLFVQTVIVEELNDSKPGLMLYEFYERPSLDKVEGWSDKHKGTLPPNTHEEWVYYLNEGSEINISYSLNSSSAYAFLVIAQGMVELCLLGFS